MGIDSSIPLGIKPGYDPVEGYGKIMTLKTMMGQQQLQSLQAQQAQMDFDQHRALQDAFSDPSSRNPDGSVNYSAVQANLAKNGAGAAIPGVAKSALDQQVTLATLGKTKAETTNFDAQARKHAAEASNLVRNQAIQELGSINSPEGLAGWVQTHTASGALNPEVGKSVLSDVQANPANFGQIKQHLMLSAVDAGKQLELTAPKPVQVNNGQQITFQDQSPLSPTFMQPVGAPVPLQATPGEVLTDTRTRFEGAAGRESAARLQRERLQFERVQSQQRVEYKEDGNGNYVALPSQLSPDSGAVPIRPVMGADGKPLQGKGGQLNESQAKSRLFASRMQAAHDVMNEVANSGVLTPSLGNQFADGVYGGSAIRPLTNSLATEQQQRLEQSQKDFLTAVLRKESGASIAPSEFADASRVYFPQRGDSPQVIAQKKHSRELAIEGFVAEVPQNLRMKPAVPIKSEKDYELLPSGTEFIDPNGVRRRKP